MPTLLIRADASESIGAGHLVRTMVLAEKLSDAGWECTYASRTPTIDIVPDILKTFPFIEIKGELATEATQLINANPDGVDCLLIDHYQWDKLLEDECRSWAGKILVIDDLANRYHNADLLLDQTLSRKKSDYENLVPKSCEILLGPEYALLREQFSEYRNGSLKKHLADDYQLERILISFGMTDPENMTGVVLEGIRQSGLKLSIDIILGKQAKYLDEVMDIADSMDCDINIYNQVTEMAKIMQNADLAIGAAGTTSWERCCLGVPSIIIVVADNQKLIADALSNYKAAIVLGDQGSIEARMFSDILLALSMEPEQLKDMAIAASTICDGLGAGRVATAIYNI